MSNHNPFQGGKPFSFHVQFGIPGVPEGPPLQGPPEGFSGKSPYGGGWYKTTGDIAREIQQSRALVQRLRTALGVKGLKIVLDRIITDRNGSPCILCGWNQFEERTVMDDSGLVPKRILKGERWRFEITDPHSGKAWVAFLCVDENACTGRQFKEAVRT